MATPPDGTVCGGALDAGPPTPDGGGSPELRSGATDGRRLGGCGRMLGGGGGVRATAWAPSGTGVLGRTPPGASGGALAGRERTGGGGGPEGFASPPGDEGAGATERDGAGGGPPGAVAGGAGVSPPGVMPGSVSRGTCGAGDAAGRGGENDGRGGTAEVPAAGVPGCAALGFPLSSIFAFSYSEDRRREKARDRSGNVAAAQDGDALSCQALP